MTKELGQILIIYNPAAHGGKAANTSNLYRHFLKKQCIPFTNYLTKGVDDTKYIHSIFEHNTFTKIVIIGGDGTLNLAINALPSLSIPIVLIPAGTGNDLAKILYQKVDLDEIFKRSIASDFSTKSIDVWKCNNQRFINVFGVGFDGELAYAMTGKKYWLPSFLKYWIEIAKHIFTYKTKTISIDNEPRSSFMLCAANGKVFGGDFYIAPTAVPDDGMLEIINIGKVSLLQRLMYLPKIQKGKHLNLNVVSYTQQDTLVIEAKINMIAQLDGEPMIASRFHIKNDGKATFLI